MTSTEIRLARPDDAEAMARLFFDTVRAVNRRDYSPKQIDAWAPRIRTAEEWRARQAGKIVTVAVHERQIVGFAELDSTGHIDCFYAHKEFQRCGVGSRLLADLESRARTLSLPRLYAEVSVTARPFFAAKNFGVVREQEVERGGVVLKHFVMEKRLTPDGRSG